MPPFRKDYGQGLTSAADELDAVGVRILTERFGGNQVAVSRHAEEELRARPVMHTAVGTTVGKMLLQMRLIGAGGVCAPNGRSRKGRDGGSLMAPTPRDRRSAWNHLGCAGWPDRQPHTSSADRRRIHQMPLTHGPRKESQTTHHPNCQPPLWEGHLESGATPVRGDGDPLPRF